jgi:putative membrane protein
MVKDHEAAVRDVERKAENADNADVRQWAAKTLPKLQQHLEQAKTLQETLENANDNSKR